MVIESIKPELLRAKVAEAVAVELREVGKKRHDEVIARGAETVVLVKAPEKDAILSDRRAAPKGKKPSKGELRQFYQLLAALSAMYRIQMKGFNSTIDVLQVQSNIIDEMAHKVAEYSKQVIAIQEEIQKHQSANPWWKQVLIALPFLILGVAITAATGGTGAALIGLAVGALIVGLSVSKDQGSKSLFDYIALGVDEAIEKMTGKELTDDQKKWINLGVKISITLVAALVTAGASYAASAAALRTAATQAAEQTAAAAGKSAGSGAVATAAGSALRASSSSVSSSVVSRSALGAEEVAKQSAKEAMKRGAGIALQRTATIRAFLASPRGVALRSFIETTNQMLDKFTSEETVDGEKRRVNVWNTPFNNETKAGKAGKEVLTWSHRGLTVLASVISLFAGFSKTTGGKFDLASSFFSKWQPFMSVAQSSAGVAINAKQAPVAATLARLYPEFARLRKEAVEAQGKLTIAQNYQQLFDTALERELTQVAHRAESVYALERGMNRAMSELYRA